MAKTGQTGLKRIWHAMFFSFAGLRAAFRHESAFRQECAMAFVLIPAAFWVGGNLVEYLLLIGTVLILLITELLNSAIEAVVDRVSDDHHTLSGRAKDMGSAAVFIALLFIATVWLAIGWQNFGAA